MIVTIHQPEFLPWLGFIDKIRQCDVFVLLDSVQFEKNYFQNRNRVRTSSGSTWITVPVFTTGRSEQKISQVEIMNEKGWTRKHLATIEQAYRRTPFFGEFFPPLEAIYQQSWSSLADLNCRFISWLADCFHLTRRFIRSSTLSPQGQGSAMLAGICKTLGATVYLSGVSGADYLDESHFKESQTRVVYQDFIHPIYSQYYSPFMPLMSSIDLLFNTGAKALSLLEKAQHKGALR